MRRLVVVAAGCALAAVACAPTTSEPERAAPVETTEAPPTPPSALTSSENTEAPTETTGTPMSTPTTGEPAPPGPAPADATERCRAALAALEQREDDGEDEEEFESEEALEEALESTVFDRPPLDDGVVGVDHRERFPTMGAFDPATASRDELELVVETCLEIRLLAEDDELDED